MTEQTGDSIAAAKKMWVFYPLMMVTGFVQLLIPSTMHLIMDDFHLKEGTAGVLPLVYFVGIVVFALFSTRLLARFSAKTLTIAGAILVCVSLVATSLSPWFALFTFFYFFAGVGNGALIILPGIYATNTCGAQTPRIQSMLFGFLSFGYIVGPLVPGLIEHLEISWRWAVAIPGLLVIPFVIPVAVARLERIKEAERLSLATVRRMVSFDRRFFFGLTLALILSGGAVLGVITWIVTFLENERGMTLGAAHVVLSGIGLALVMGRLVCGQLSKRFRVYRIELVIVPLSAVLVFIAPLPGSAVVNSALFLVSALVYSGVYPLLLSAASIYPRSDSAAAYTVFFLCVSLGGMTIPYALGQVFQHAGAVAGMSSSAVILVSVLGCLLFFRKELPLSEHANHRAYPA
ncbi:MAG: MFS transporter [Actinobacteria bacterium]|nr:MFS transporter [Actinomycetota bacterium]MBU1943284.1 MFS transporter [Actinomycetota bacterium]MBU2688967.1 MFS transporter [Actinomycetota bacterium]